MRAAQSPSAERVAADPDDDAIVDAIFFTDRMVAREKFCRLWVGSS